eukprot:Gb_35835 [translate_table: standard]
MEGEGPSIHPAIAPISFLLGTWRGEGEGGFPTIQSFKYGEEIKFWHSGKLAMGEQIQRNFTFGIGAYDVVCMSFADKQEKWRILKSLLTNTQVASVRGCMHGLRKLVEVGILKFWSLDSDSAAYA